MTYEIPSVVNSCKCYLASRTQAETNSGPHSFPRALETRHVGAEKALLRRIYHSDGC